MKLLASKLKDVGGKWYPYGVKIMKGKLMKLDEFKALVNSQRESQNAENLAKLMSVVNATITTEKEGKN